MEKRARTDALVQAKEIANNLTLQAEQYKATVRKPEGTFISYPEGVSDPTPQGLLQVENARSLVTDKVQGMTMAMPVLPPSLPVQQPAISEDDEFFHLTCHVDNGLKTKIERGEFVELEKLLPKARSVNQRFSDENRMQLVNRDGYSYWVPVEKDKIGSVQRWEQAFRIYAAIYSRANPGHAYEIWQYVHTITTAAANFAWDNVAEYDFTFRQLMATYPQRSWSRLYNHMWSLCMKDPVNKHSNVGGRNNNFAGRRSDSQKGDREKYCWRFNKNKCKRANCEWEHRCKFCDAWGHGVWNCFKKLAKQSKGGKADEPVATSN